MDWIHITERLPDYGKDVLIWNETLKCCDIRQLIDESYPDDPELCNKHIWTEQGIFNKIEWWTPLPEQPERLNPETKRLGRLDILQKHNLVGRVNGCDSLNSTVT